jgi:hypothetical protein
MSKQDTTRLREVVNRSTINVNRVIDDLSSLSYGRCSHYWSPKSNTNSPLGGSFFVHLVEASDRPSE